VALALELWAVLTSAWPLQELPALSSMPKTPEPKLDV